MEEVEPEPKSNNFGTETLINILMNRTIFLAEVDIVCSVNGVSPFRTFEL